MIRKKKEKIRQTVISVKTFKCIHQKVVYMANYEDRSISNLVERLIRKEIIAFEKKQGKIPLKGS